MTLWGLVRARWAVLVGLRCVLAGMSALAANKMPPPTLEGLLQRLQSNLDHYDADVPSLFCDEHVISRVVPGSRSQNTAIDSMFRLKRTLNPDQTTTFEELREIKMVDGNPATSQEIDGPALLIGAFEGGLAVVSLNQEGCMNYTLQRINQKRPSEPYVVRFTTALTYQNSADCVLQEDSKGRVFIDPTSMQITRLEIRTPHHMIIPKSSYASPIIGERLLAVDYAPVLLGNETFWMAAKVNSRSTSGSGTFHAIVWSFLATYRNYHKLEVTSRILPAKVAALP